jgi:hypothetical protein
MGARFESFRLKRRHPTYPYTLDLLLEGEWDQQPTINTGCIHAGPTRSTDN